MGRSKTDFKIDQSNLSKRQLHHLGKKLKKSKHQVTHRPITRSISQTMTEFSFCSIPLRKTNKKFKLRADSKENQSLNINNNDPNYNTPPAKHCASSESMIVLYEGKQNALINDCTICDRKDLEFQLSHSNQDLPKDLKDIKLDPMSIESGCGDFCCHLLNHSDLTVEDEKVIEESLKIMDEIHYSGEGMVKVNSLTDMTIDNLINLYLFDEKRPSTNSQCKRRKH